MKFIVVFAAAAVMAGTAAAETYLERSSAIDYIPAQDDVWHEVWPDYCTSHCQDEYEDNGDGVVSAGDRVRLDGANLYVDWAGSTYCMASLLCSNRMIVEPAAGVSPHENPTGQVWNEVYPTFCDERIVEEWRDDGDLLVGASDEFLLDGQWWRICEVRTSIIGMPASPVEETTWTRVKEFFTPR